MKKLIVFSLLGIVVMFTTCNANFVPDVDIIPGVFVHEPSDFDINVIRATIFINILISISFIKTIIKNKVTKGVLIKNIILIFVISVLCCMFVKISSPEIISSSDDESLKSTRPTIVRIFDFSRW